MSLEEHKRKTLYFQRGLFSLKAFFWQNKQMLKQGKLEVDCFKGDNAFGNMVLYSVAFGTPFWLSPLMPCLSSGAVWPQADHSPSLTRATQKGELIPMSPDTSVAHLVTAGDLKLGCVKGMPRAKVSKPVLHEFGA